MYSTAMPPNHSLKLTENTARFFAARKKLFREMATSTARMRHKDPAPRRRSLALSVRPLATIYGGLQARNHRAN